MTPDNRKLSDVRGAFGIWWPSGRYEWANPVISLRVFLDRNGIEAQCREVSAKAHWSEGFRCPECGHKGRCHLTRRGMYQCNRCKRQVSLTSGTLFAQTSPPLSSSR